jgi:hypothetical protein
VVSSWLDWKLTSGAVVVHTGGVTAPTAMHIGVSGMTPLCLAAAAIYCIFAAS